jgi:hypothetical protein
MKSYSALERIFNETLDGLDLSTKSARKYEQVLGRLSVELKLPSAAIAIKALGAPKNYGNRISEATRGDAEVLILIATSPIDLDALGRTIAARALRYMPTLVGIHAEDGWMFRTAFLVAGQLPPFPFDQLEVIELVREESDTADRNDVGSVVAAIESLDGTPADDGRIAAIAALSPTGRGVAVKRAMDSKNLRNRIGEAAGRRVRVVVVETLRELADSASSLLAKALAGRAKGYIVWSEGGHMRVRDASGQVEHEVDGRLTASEYRRLPRVKELHRHLPIDAGADRLYEEHQDASDRLVYETQTLSYLRQLLASERRVIVILTGNAGHGKTHMCRRMLEADGANTDVMELLGDDKLGAREWGVAGSPLRVRVVKDLSEISPAARAAEVLEELLTQESAHVVICANEGRLRDVVGHIPRRARLVLDALEAGLDTGATCSDEQSRVHVVNLNFQGATSGAGGFFAHAMDHFLKHESAWKACDGCAASDQCPIKSNRNKLAMSPRRAAENLRHREVLIELVRVAEQAGYVLTYREALILVAYLVTGGLACEGVEKLHRGGRTEELRKHDVLDLLFEVRLPSDAADVLRILPRLRRMDPGAYPIRSVDDEIVKQLEEKDDADGRLFDLEPEHASKRSELKREQERHRQRIRAERRFAWFEAPERDSANVSRTSRLGLRHYPDFALLQGWPEPSEVIAIIRRLVRGLHTIQGAVGVDSMTSLHLVDPAFGRSGSHAAIIARSFRVRDLDLVSESRWWQECSGRKPQVLASVEWLDRRVVLVDRTESRALLVFDLRTFEFVMNAADGVVMREFHSAERRRILRTLAKDAERARRAGDEIRVLLERGEGRLTLERDNTILLERSS